jgi:non-specific protein-tyrosine kinase
MQGAERSSGLVAWALPRSSVSEAFRALRTNIRFASVDKPLTAILVTSAEPGTGKTTVAINLGIVSAQAGFRIVLIDTDLRRPRLHEAFGLSNLTGLTDLLVGDIQDVEAQMQETEIDNLRLIASGAVPPNPSELLGSKRMEAVLAEAKRHADLVILDTSPVLPVTDAAVLAPKMDGVLLVVRANRTHRDAGQQAAEGLVQVGGNMMGVVLTDAPTPRRSDYRYPYYRKGKQKRGWWPLRWKSLLARARGSLPDNGGPADARADEPDHLPDPTRTPPTTAVDDRVTQHHA